MQPSEGLAVPEITKDGKNNGSRRRAISSEPILENLAVLREIETLLRAATDEGESAEITTSRTPPPTNTLELLVQVYTLAEKMPNIVGHATGEEISKVTFRQKDWEYLIYEIEKFDKKERNICQEYRCQANGSINPITLIQKFLDKLASSNWMEIYLPDQVLKIEEADLAHITKALQIWLNRSTSTGKFPDGLRGFLTSLKQANSLSLFDVPADNSEQAKEVATINDPDFLELIALKIRSLPEAIEQLASTEKQKPNFESPPLTLDRLEELLPFKYLKPTLTESSSEEGIDLQKKELAYKIIQNLLRLGLDHTMEIFNIPLRNIPARPTGHRSSRKNIFSL